MAPPHQPAPPPLSPADVLQATAVKFLLDGSEGERRAACLLLSAGMATQAFYRPSADFFGEAFQLAITLAGPRKLYETLTEEQPPDARAWAAYHDGEGPEPEPMRSPEFGHIEYALRAATPPGWELKPIQVTLEPVDIGPNWRDELSELATGRDVSNQGQPVQGHPVRVWNNLNFRSASEVRIAQALDKAGALYWPNGRARLGEAGARRNLEADFLVCYRGRWGILEVDGEPFHPAERRTEEQVRDRAFQHHGVRVVQHFDADRCFEESLAVVREFLKLLLAPAGT